MKFAASDAMLAYFGTLETELNRAIEHANRARANGADPTPTIEIPIAKDLADRVEKLLSIEGVAKKLRELETTMSREEAALQVAIAVAKGEIKSFESNRDAIEAAVRVAMAVLTEGVVAAPIEGIAKIDLAKNDDGTEYIRIYYAGPIRSAGGTAQALSVLAADYVRANLGIARFVPRSEEVERYVEEITAYRRVANLQYLPSDEEIRLIVRNCPICIDGEPTEEAEVEGRRDLPRIETNRIRGGMALVIAEGIALKAPKVKKHVDKLKLEGWDWLDKFVVTVKTDDASAQLKPKDKYLQDLIAGRPVFSYPSRPGGFRLRYGRGRNTSFAAAGISPATMVMMDDFIAAGTQIKVERPGKAAGIAPVDTIDGPTVRLFNGDVLSIRTAEEAQKIRPSVKQILDIGEILINFGDFLENNHPLVPSSYCFEWWLQELMAKTSIKEPGDLKNPDQEKALFLSDNHKVPLHPKYTYLWHDISIEEFSQLSEYIHKNGTYSGRLSFELDEKIKNILEVLLIPHIVREKKVVIEEPLPLMRCLGLDTNLKKTSIIIASNILDTVSKTSGITIRARAPIRIGARMGRPEKSDKREMKPAPHVLFPIGGAGGKRRSLVDVKDFVDDEDIGKEKNNEFKNSEFQTGLTYQKGKVGTINVQIGQRICPACQNRTFKNRCTCGKFTYPLLKCPSCGIEVKIPYTGTKHLCPKCKKETTSVTEMDIDFISEYQLALDNLGERDVFKPKGVLGLTSKNKTPEPLEKGVLRAKHDVVMFKDGTVRYDLSDMPLTHIKPAELGVSVSKFKELGYVNDTYGNPLVDANQILELKVQDIVVSKDCAEYLLKTAHFIDDLLTRYYKVESYYNIDKIDDLIGKLVIGLAPHTSAGVLARLVGFTTASVGYAHPFFHAAKRRNCFCGDEKLLVQRGENFELLTIRELVELNLIENIQKDDFGTEYKKVKGLKTFAFNIKTKKFELADITHVSKHISPENLIEIKTKSGRKIVVTKDHMFPDRSGEKVRAQDADELLIPWNVIRPPLESKEKIDLLSIKPGITVKEDFLSLLGLKIGKDAKTKRVPNFIYSLPKEKICAFLRGYFTGDGSYSLQSTLEVNVTSVNKWLIDAVSYLLMFSGIKHSICQSPPIEIGGLHRKEQEQLIDKEAYKNMQKLYKELKNTPTDIPHVCSSVSGRLNREETLSVFRKVLMYNNSDAALTGFRLFQNRTRFEFLLQKQPLSLQEEHVCRYVNSASINKCKGSIPPPDKSDGILYPLTPCYEDSYKIRIYGSEAGKFIEDIGFFGEKQKNALELLKQWLAKKGSSRTSFDEDVFIDKVVEKKEIISRDKYVYNLTVDPHHSLICSGITTFQCDGDEDCVMLLMDGLVNFSRSYLPDRRGGQMDAPLVLTSRIDPNEVDKEAHNVDVLFQYPLAFYEATLKYANPKDLVKIMDTVTGRLGTPAQYEGFGFTHDTANIAAGPRNSAYKTLGTMIEKMEAQLGLARKIKAVDPQDVAERVINSHFLPDLIGNLRSFSKQKVRCTKCGAKYRRPPLQGTCPRCGGNIVLTVHEGSVRKYLETSLRIADEYNVRHYTKQRLELLEIEMRSLFESDKVKQKGLADFM